MLLLERLVVPTRVETRLLLPLAYTVDLVGALPLEPTRPVLAVVARRMEWLQWKASLVGRCIVERLVLPIDFE